MDPIISFIVPVYNIEKYLSDCIESLINQPFQNIEIILVDDGSTDRSGLICDSYANNDDRIKVLHKPNGGLVSARKAGVAVAEGKYIAAIDGDDWLSENCCLRLYDIILEHQPDIIIFGSIEKDDSNGQETRMNLGLRNGYYSIDEIREEIFPLLIESDMGKALEHCIWGKLIKRELYVPYQNNVNEIIEMGEDAACSIPIIVNSNNLYVLEEYLYYYRRRAQSITFKKKPLKLEEPLLITDCWKDSISVANYNFMPQVYRFIVHNLFNACSSRFYSDKKYNEIKKEISLALNTPFYSEAIIACKFNCKHYKGQLARFSLKHRLFFLMKIYCHSSFKTW